MLVAARLGIEVTPAMSLSAALNRLDKRYAWSLLGFVLALVFGFLSLYTEFLRDRRPQIRFEVISDASVLDVREKLGNLEIIYDGVDIQKARRSLRVIIIRVTNEGPDDVLKTHYDEKAPLGFRVLHGKLIRAEVLASSNLYLREMLASLGHVADRAVFPPVILEAGEWFTVKSLILHSEGSRPTLEPTGKIAGVREIRRVDSTEAAAEPGFWSQAFSGGPWVQAARLPTYFFGLILVVLGMVAPIATASGALAKRRRRQHVSQFKSMTKLQLTDSDEFIFERYIETDLRYLMRLHGKQGWQADMHVKQTLNEFVRFVRMGQLNPTFFRQRKRK
ncbi:MAG TPA: hypothetical protein VGS22_12730 [Thermoanaerobaculia bacterium]|jgi:hypothetical protein|nr:hypothetical protein [Thermoanaerobaculia bacterium]